jgi:tetratricopeptide (TPR) repeat protein
LRLNSKWTLSLLLLLAGCASHPTSTMNSNAYVDPAVCASCHAEIAKTYRETGMGRSFYRPAAAAVPSGSSFYHDASDRHYEFSGRGGKFFLSRYQIGYAGKQDNRIEKAIDFVVGSGNHARTYLHLDGEGQLVELPVSWYSEHAGHVAMSPGYDNAHQEDFRRRVPDDCLFCHNGYPRNGNQISGIAEGIDCQRCHGPGGNHVEAAKAGAAKLEQIRMSIVNPARLDRDRQLDDCMQCHLETTSLRLPNAIRNYDRAPFSYRPGEPLTDYALFFDHAPNTGFEDRFEVAHQAYRLRKSACFLESRMTCSTCHDSHRALSGEKAIEHYVKVCHSCHAGAHRSGMPSGGASCLDCHMWKRRTEDAVHVVMTDHFIQRRKPARDLLGPLTEKIVAYQGAVAPYYTGRPPAELYLAVAQVEHESDLARGILRLEQAIAKNQPGQPEFYVELGKAQSKAAKPAEAIRWFEEALRHRDGFHPALRELAAALAISGNLARAIEIGERACAQQPPDTVALTNLGNAYLRQGRADRAKEILGRALTINPDLPGAHNLLGLAWLAKQNPAAAESSFREAVGIQPDMSEAHNNLGNLLASRHEYSEAAYHFQKAVASNPSYVDAHHSYGLLLVLMHSPDQAMAELKEALRLDPNSAQLHIDFADMLLDKGRAAAADEEYRQAIRLNPGLSEAYYGLGNALAARRKDNDAMRAFQQAIQRNPNYYEAHLALGIAMRKAGNMTEARPHLQKAVESDDAAIRAAAAKALQ